MLESNADADGIVSDAHYEARVSRWNVNRWRIFEPLVIKVLWLVGPGARVVDLGAGEGFFTRCCLAHGLDAIALEGSPAAVQWARTHLGVDAHVHNLKDSLPINDASVDLVMYHDVYEHVPDRVNRIVFAESRRILRPRGYLWVITTCRYDAVETAEPEHINNPTPTELLRYGKQLGFGGTMLRPAFNLSLFTGPLRDGHGRVVAWKQWLRRILKTHHRYVSLVCAPVWLPLWYVNSRLIRRPELDFVAQTSNVLFQKPVD